MGGHRGFFVSSVAIVALVVGLASGCSGAQGASGPDASPSRSARTSATPTSSSTPSATLDDEARTRIPQAARAHTAKGAEAYFRYYVEQLNAGFVNPEAHPVLGLSTTSCESCGNLESSILELARAHQHVSPEPYSVAASAELPQSQAGQRAFQFVLKERPSNVVASSGEQIRRQPGASHVMEVLLTPVGDGWLVADLALSEDADQ